MSERVEEREGERETLPVSFQKLVSGIAHQYHAINIVHITILFVFFLLVSKFGNAGLARVHNH